MLHNNFLNSKSGNTDKNGKKINYQTPGYCGVPVVRHNTNLFENLPLRTSHTLSQNEYKQRFHPDIMRNRSKFKKHQIEIIQYNLYSIQK